jgi:hypothetical protein
LECLLSFRILDVTLILQTSVIVLCTPFRAKVLDLILIN